MSALPKNSDGYLAASVVYERVAKSLAPRAKINVSQWAANERHLSAKESALPGKWSNERNPMLVEPMDALSPRSKVHKTVLKFPIQFGKTAIAQNVLGCYMDTAPCPIMVALPGEASLNKWVAQKLNPFIEETPAVAATLISQSSRNSANTRTFKDFSGGQLYIEHAGAPQRLKSTSVKVMIVDEVDEFAVAMTTGDDPMLMILGRVSGFPSSYKVLYISTPGIFGLSRIHELWEESDQRKYHVPCPHCGERQPLEWSGLKWNPDASHAWYVCRECGAEIEESHKTEMIRQGRWVPKFPGREIRGYTANCLYYPFGLGPRWAEMAKLWLQSQGDPAKLKTFINDRLAEVWFPKGMDKMKANVLQDRAEPYRLRVAPRGVLMITAGVDTQDNRLEVQIIGWGRGMRFWTLDYAVIPGDPAKTQVWEALAKLLNTPIQHESGVTLAVTAAAIDGRGHRTEFVKKFVRRHLIRRPMCIFGAKANTAPILSKPKWEEITEDGKLDKEGINTWNVGTVAIKDYFFRILAADGESESPEERISHFSTELDKAYFDGLVSEVYDPRSNRYVKKRGGARNEPLDTWGYAFAAANHPEVRLHRWSDADWDTAERRIMAAAQAAKGAQPQPDPDPAPALASAVPTPAAPAPGPAENTRPATPQAAPVAPVAPVTPAPAVPNPPPAPRPAEPQRRPRRAPSSYLA